MTQTLIILHTNDIHGNVEGLARIATLVAQVKAEDPDTPVFYFDCGDVEEPSSRLSNVTKGTAMHRLLNAAGCDAAVAGNGAWLRYGPQVLAEHGAAARYPLLAANLRTHAGDPLAGVQPAVLLQAGSLRLGVIGVTTDMPEYTAFFNLQAVPTAPLVRELAAALRQDGADAVVVLSHLGLAADRELAADLQEDVVAILGGHSHDLLPEGERIGRVFVAQAGQYAGHVGRLDLAWDDEQAMVTAAAALPVPETMPPSATVLAEAQAIEAAGVQFLAEIIGELAESLDFATDRECAAGNLMADVLQERMGGQVAVTTGGHAFIGPLPGGPVSRGALWEVCTSTANPAVVTMTGAQLAALVAKGLDLTFAAERPHTLRGNARGLIHLSGATVRGGQLLVGGEPVEPGREYLVAGSDWEFESYGGYVERAWDLRPRYEVPTILREALEEYLATHRPVRVQMGRLG
ncbi:MAG: bifunctional UDP-sugar hydrolase/5'-nucleotidase [Chloroflexi bacterium]|nr:bifunctional UDP-sugar hydrolase/5'-nucleotidase [Chloroflexota bacterium]